MRSISTAASSSARWTSRPAGDQRSVAARDRLLVPLVVLTIYYGVHPGADPDGSAASVAQPLHLRHGPGRCGEVARCAVIERIDDDVVLHRARHHFLPEIILAVGVLALILIGAWRGEKRGRLVDGARRRRSRPRDLSIAVRRPDGATP